MVQIARFLIVKDRVGDKVWWAILDCLTFERSLPYENLNEAECIMRQLNAQYRERQRRS